jgi:hypothetical protein
MAMQTLLWFFPICTHTIHANKCQK